MADEETRPAPTFGLIEKGFLTVSSHTEIASNQSVADIIATLTSTADTSTSAGSDND
ncbi:hypothetical protein [Arthrobacter sp. MMS18-M83]|uniref:hypothetical protein n=1 Tax=Arthrobacter sp. MMS18-M83 TaxID=2996261 RepID=UPI00227D68B9|nr:hypothetical protein [Arthrobacter sp. MMS18-M83]WAH97759.1 hypothetical protein OW521_02330 [Arthrobacter sp. MMS18-M83]